MILAAFELPKIVDDHLALWVAGFITAACLLIYGFRDTLRFSLTRAWAISSVCWQESIRRRVLWIIPLAILGVVVVSQLQKAVDPQDVVRQTVKFCVFTTGLIVVVTAIIMACTSLPKEIESRVIFTVVTKPTTRLEIIVGKVIGFARVSGVILLLMGLFTWGYLHVRAWNLNRGIADSLTSPTIEASMIPTLRHYQEFGLLTNRHLEPVDDLQVYSRVPERNDPRRYMFGGVEGEMLVPFYTAPESLIPIGAPPDTPPGAGGLLLELRLGFDVTRSTDVLGERELPPLIANPDAPPPSTQPAASLRKVSVMFLDNNLNTLVDARHFNRGEPIDLTDPTGQRPVYVPLATEGASIIAMQPTFWVRITGLDRDTEYFAAEEPVRMIVPALQGQRPIVLRSIPDPRDTGKSYQETRRRPPTFRSADSRFGQRLRGSATERTSIALFRFRDAKPEEISDGKVTFELRGVIERSGAEAENIDVPTELHIEVAARDSDTVSERIVVNPESARTSYFSVPASFVESGNFDVRLTVRTSGHYLSIQPSSMRMISKREPFALNLLKSLFVLWLLSLLVVIVATFCSTFVSWPIAIVLTLLLLTGRWIVSQLGDATAPGIGPQIAQEMFGAQGDPNAMKLVSTSMEQLARGLNLFAGILPDISTFAAVDTIERGVVMPWSVILQSLTVLGLFGLPMIALAYLFFSFKEVAP